MDRLTKFLLEIFELHHGASLRAGVLSPALIGRLVRGIAFELLAHRDDSTDLRSVFGKAEQAAVAAEAQLRATQRPASAPQN